MEQETTGPALRVVKQRYDGSTIFAWTGRLLEQTDEHVLLAGLFNGQSRDLGYVILERGDLFLEWYYFGRWYNIFQIYGLDGQLKGWYCNIGMPPALGETELSYVDLALDVFVYPDGRHLVLDEDEFAELKRDALRAEDATLAEHGLAELLALVTGARLPSRAYAPGIAPPVA
jgi:protein associated with RNAse G/E